MASNTTQATGVNTNLLTIKEENKRNQLPADKNVFSSLFETLKD
jgi:hypothetical protein